jgi:UDP-N-acetylmuramoylalanine--D-glutamate ligase
VARLNDILWINDSKATNPHAAAASLSAFDPVVWIAGGLPKGVEYDDLVRAHAARLRSVVLIGADSSALRDALARHAPQVPVIEAVPPHTGGRHASRPTASGEEVMALAVAAAAAQARPGDTVLMAPAAASMDQFASYAHRGDAFIEAVRGYVEGQAQTSKEP